MITAVLTASIDSVEVEAVMGWAVRVANYINETFGTNIAVHVNVAGNNRQVHWASTYESLGDYEATFAKIQADEGYQALVAETRQNGYVGATKFATSLYRSVP